jgi:hypothetical protein
MNPSGMEESFRNYHAVKNIYPEWIVEKLFDEMTAKCNESL